MRRYHRSKPPPKKLVSNWPDLSGDNDGLDYADQGFHVGGRAPISSDDPRKKWEYIVRDQHGNQFLSTKDRTEAVKFRQTMTNARHKLKIFYWEPSSAVLHEIRLRETADWRWNRGFGA